MQCLEPLSIPNPNGKGPQDRFVVPCGKCAACLTNRRNEWTTRLIMELEVATSAHFITLTYDEEHVLYGARAPTLSKSDLQKFLKRLRKSIEPSKIRYYAVGEYGTTTYRPHYHILMFNLPSNKIDVIQEKWPFGFVDVGTVTGGSIHYVTKYHINRNHSPKGSEPSFSVMSRRPAIGINYIERYGNYHRNNIDRTYVLHRGGEKSRLPRIYKNKLYTQAERDRIREKALSEGSGIYDEEKIDEHYRNNEGLNYFDYQLQKKQNFEDNFKIKVNKLNKL